MWLQPGQRVLSVAADTQFCERICYDWVVEDRGSEGAMVDLSFEIVFRSIVHAPAWDVLHLSLPPEHEAGELLKIDDT